MKTFRNEKHGETTTGYAAVAKIATLTHVIQVIDRLFMSFTFLGKYRHYFEPHTKKSWKRAAYQWPQMYVQESSPGGCNGDPKFPTPSV